MTSRDHDLLRTDPRLAETACQLEVLRGRDQQEVDRAEFKQLILANIVLISRALRHQLVIPDFSSFTNIIDIIFEETAAVQEGVVASYIPQLAKCVMLETVPLLLTLSHRRIDPAKFGLSLATVDGQRHSRGDAEEKFSLQSVAKPLIYAIALNELGRDVVHRWGGGALAQLRCSAAGMWAWSPPAASSTTWSWTTTTSRTTPS